MSTACNCEPSGSLDKGICDSRTDPVNGLVSGQCHCKQNVDGRRCDTCKNGFWNLTESNPLGCIRKSRIFSYLAGYSVFRSYHGFFRFCSLFV